MKMKFVLQSSLALAAIVFTLNAVITPSAFAQSADSGESAAPAAEGSSGDPQTGSPAQGSAEKEESTVALPVFCPTGHCYGSVFGSGDSSDCAAGSKGTSPGQDSCGQWAGGGSAPAATSRKGQTTQ